MFFILCGWCASVLIIFAYFLVSTKRCLADGPIYQLMNLIGSIGLIIIGIHSHISSIVFLNGTWSLISLYALYIMIHNKYNKI